MSSPLEDLTESPPTTIHSLPLETIIHIMSHAEDADILSAALVCRTWRNPAQKALVRDLRSGLATERWAQGPSASRLGDDVRSVEGIHIRVDVLLPVILQCGQLRGLVLTVSNNATWSLLRHPRLAGTSVLASAPWTLTHSIYRAQVPFDHVHFKRPHSSPHEASPVPPHGRTTRTRAGYRECVWLEATHRQVWLEATHRQVHRRHH